MIIICWVKFGIEIVAGLAAVVGAIVSVVVYKQTLNRDKKLATINIINEIRNKYPRVSKLSWCERQSYLREMEFLCTGINEGIYELSILKRMSGRLFLSQYRIIKPYLEARRKTKPSAEEAWHEYESVMQKLNLLYSCNGCSWRKWFCRKCK